MLVLLKDEGLVARAPHPSDRRARAITITSKGRNVYGQLTAEIKPLQNLLLDLFDENEAVAFAKSLNRISEAMANYDLDEKKP